VTIDDRGTGQGSVIAPFLANVYLHYCFDLWAERWRRHEARGYMIVVRYADDLVVGFEKEDGARRFLDAMRDRLGEFQLSLHTALGETPSRQSSRWRSWCSGATRTSSTPTSRTTWKLLHTAPQLMK
jgi:hypothetical protein